MRGGAYDFAVFGAVADDWAAIEVDDIDVIDDIDDIDARAATAIPTAILTHTSIRRAM